MKEGNALLGERGRKVPHHHHQITIQGGVTKEASETWNWWTKSWNSDFQDASPVLSSALPPSSYSGNAKGIKSNWLYPQDWKVLAPWCKLATDLFFWFP